MSPIVAASVFVHYGPQRRLVPPFRRLEFGHSPRIGRPEFATVQRRRSAASGVRRPSWKAIAT